MTAKKNKKKTPYLHKCKLLVKLKKEITDLKNRLASCKNCGCFECSGDVIKYCRRVKNKTNKINLIKNATEARC